MADVPDIAGFKDAQERLVDGLGTDVTFRFTPVETFASGVFIDPEIGLPLDPLVTASTSVASADIVVRATVIRKQPAFSRAGGNDGEQTVAGSVPNGTCWLRIPDGTYDPSIMSATYVDIGGESFVIQRFIEEGIGQIDRLYVECELVTDGLT